MFTDLFLWRPSLMRSVTPVTFSNFHLYKYIIYIHYTIPNYLCFILCKICLKYITNEVKYKIPCIFFKIFFSPRLTLVVSWGTRHGRETKKQNRCQIEYVNIIQKYVYYSSMVNIQILVRNIYHSTLIHILHV